MNRFFFFARNGKFDETDLAKVEAILDRLKLNEKSVNDKTRLKALCLILDKTDCDRAK